jgi:3-hydroxypropanoate dehydrogenase
MTSTQTRPEALDEAARSTLFYDARTANTFADIPVSDEQLREIWEMARWAPTAANAQPLRVQFVRTDEGKQRLAALMSEGNREKTLTAPAVALLARDDRFHDHFPETFPLRPEMSQYFEANAEMRDDTGNFNAALQAGYFILAVRAAGLAAGPMKGFDGPGIDAEFFADKPWSTVLVVNIGLPGADAWFDRLPRLGHDDVVAWA